MKITFNFKIKYVHTKKFFSICPKARHEHEVDIKVTCYNCQITDVLELRDRFVDNQEQVVDLDKVTSFERLVDIIGEELLVDCKVEFYIKELDIYVEKDFRKVQGAASLY